MPSPTRISELAATISSNTALIDGYLKSNGLPPLSLDYNAPAHPPISDVSIQKARQAVIDATGELQAIVKGPAELLRVGWTDNVSLHAITRFNIASSFPVGSTSTFSEISKITGLTERNTRRLIRHGIPNYLFAEPKPGIIEHTGLTALLATDEKIYWNVTTGLEEFWRTATFTIDALERWPESEEPTEAGFALANGVGGNKSMWEVYEENPKRGELFGKCMSGMDKVKGYEPRLLIDGWDWASLGKGCKVVDIGGSHGTVMINLGREFKDLEFVIQDLPKVIKEARDMCPQDVRGRVDFMEHDFFTPQPVCADVYYMRSILHNWSNKYSIQILRNLIPSLKKGARILVHELVIPEPGTLSLAEEKRIRHLDIGMLQLLNSHQREAGEWEDLFREADERFKFIGIKKPKEAAQSLIEVEWIG